jgi:hypothetical protein
VRFIDPGATGVGAEQDDFEDSAFFLEVGRAAAERVRELFVNKFDDAASSRCLRSGRWSRLDFIDFRSVVFSSYPASSRPAKAASLIGELSGNDRSLSSREQQFRLRGHGISSLS